MPTPLEILLDPISLMIVVMYATLMLWEAIAPARKLPIVKGWKVRALTAFVVFFYLSTYLPLLWNGYLAQHQLFDLSQFSILSTTLIGLAVIELGIYIWHRTMHSSKLLWRMFHQMHHSAERLDSYGAFYFSPLDMIGWTALSSLCLTLLVGLPAQAATNVILFTTFFAIFQHANINTPRWLGYFIQRPESHTVHHATDIHFNNFSDLPVFDILFGTFKNPKTYKHETGLFPGASAQIVDMLLMRDLQENSDVSTNNKNTISAQNQIA